MVIGVTFCSLQKTPKSRDLEFIPLPLIFKTKWCYHHFLSIKMFDRGITKELGEITDKEKSGILPQIHIQQIKQGISIYASLVIK